MDLLASLLVGSVVKGSGGGSEENARKAAYLDMVGCLFSSISASLLIVFFNVAHDHIDHGGGGHIECCSCSCHMAGQTRVSEGGGCFSGTKSWFCWVGIWNMEIQLFFFVDFPSPPYPSSGQMAITFNTHLFLNPPLLLTL